MSESQEQKEISLKLLYILEMGKRPSLDMGTDFCPKLEQDSTRTTIKSYIININCLALFLTLSSLNLAKI